MSKKNIDIKKDIILNSKPEIDFFLEGGNLISGLFYKLAIQVKDINNRNISIKGTQLKTPIIMKYAHLKPRYFNITRFWVK